MNEEEVADRFVKFLEDQGYVVTEKDIYSRTRPDVVAQKNEKTLIAQLKGTPPKPQAGVDFGTGIWQIMKYMHEKDADLCEYAIVISDTYVDAAKKCEYPLKKVGVKVYLVKEDGVSVLF